MRFRLRMLWTCVLLVVLITAMFPAVTSAKAERTESFTIITADNVPLLNISIGGTLSGTFSGTQDSFAIDWTFRGFSSGGGPATASGTGAGSWNPSSHTLTLTLTSISSWNIPGFRQPQLPKSATVTRLGPTLVSVSVGDIVGGIPMVVAPPFGNPFTNPFQFWVASALGTGSVNLDALPGAHEKQPAGHQKSGGQDQQPGSHGRQ